VSKLTEYWEDYDRNFDNFEKDGFNFEDLLLKTKFGFKGGKYTFSSKSKFNFGAKNSAVHEYGLKHKCPRGTIDFKHKAQGETSVESDTKCLAKDNITLNSFSKFTLDQGQDRNKLTADVMFRVHHKDNALVSFGAEKWNPYAGAPNVLSLHTSYGSVYEGTNLTFNTYLNFDLQNKFVPTAKFLVKGQKGDLTGYFLAAVKRNQVETDEKDKPILINQAVDATVKFIKTIDQGKKYGGALTYSLEKKETNASVFASHSMDRVKCNAKISTDRTLSLGITSAFDDLTLGFSAKTSLNSKTEKVGEADLTKHWANYKFGLTAEFTRL